MENKKGLGQNIQEHNSKSYEIKVLDPRPNADNSKIFESKKVYGIEITIPALAEKCIYNLDPQHTGGDVNTAAISEAISSELPPEDAILVTIRPDLDSFGSMAIFNIRREKQVLTPDILEKVETIRKFDTFAHGDWQGDKELPTNENPWPEGKNELIPLNGMVMDFKVPASERVWRLQKWFDGNEIPKDYEQKAEKERKELICALENGEIKLEVKDGIALVEATHRSGIEIGYRKAPIVIALNPKFQLQGEEPHRKYTIAQYKDGYIDMKTVLAELQKIESGWGGSPNIIGSPQGVSSSFSSEKIFEIVKNNKLH